MLRTFRILTAAALLVELAGPGAVLAQQLGAKLAAAASDETIAAVRIENLGALLQKLDRFGAPFNAQVSAMFPLFAPTIFQSSAAGQLDLSKPITLVIANPRKHAVPLAYVATAADAAAFLGGMGTAGAAEAGITEYQGQKATLYGAAEGGEVLVAGSKALATAALAAQPAPGLLPQARGDLVASVPVAGLLKLYAAEIEQGKAKMLAQMEAAPAKPGQPDPKQMRALMNAYAEMLLGFGAQVQTAVVALELDEGDVVLRQALQPVAGSKLESFLRGQGTVRGDLLAHLPQDAPMAFGFWMQSTPEMVEAYTAMFEMLASTPSPSGATAEATPGALPAEMRTAFGQLWQDFGPLYAGAILPALPDKPGMRMVMYFDYKKPEEYHQRMQQWTEQFGPMLHELYKSMGMDAKVAYVPAGPGFPSGTMAFQFQMGQMPDEQRQALERMWGSSTLNFYALPVGGRILGAMGAEPAALLTEWSARLAGAAAPAPAQAATAGQRVMDVRIDIAAYMNWVVEMMPAEQRDKARQEMQFLLQTPQTMVMTATLEGANLTFETRYPLETTLKAVKAKQAGGVSH